MVETPDKNIYIRQRKGRDIWGDLYEFILWETDEPLYPDEIMRSDFARGLFGGRKLTVKHISKLHRQELSHQTIQGYFISVLLDSPLAEGEGYFPVDKRRLGEYAFPRFINGWLQDPTPVQSLF